MGLDIRIYTNLKFARSHHGDGDFPPEWENGQWLLINNSRHYQRQVADLQPSGFWSATRGDGFRAGSYGGYNDWRNQLALHGIGVAAEEVWKTPARYSESAFFDLIFFSDCEGFIGPTACRRLANAFTEKLPTFPSGYFSDKAREWAEACHVAADNFGGLNFT